MYIYVYVYMHIQYTGMLDLARHAAAIKNGTDYVSEGTREEGQTDARAVVPVE
jgi:hypothetical protein